MSDFNKPSALQIKRNPIVDWKKRKNNFNVYICASDLDSVSDKKKIFLNLIVEGAIAEKNMFKFDEPEDEDNFEFPFSEEFV